eukprot:scaffold22620_cov131-Cylindrotheca_fusiformis.AAC.3
MSSMQQSAPGSKSMKFQNGLNPFTPFLSRPGEELEGAEKTLAENLDRRLQVNHDSSSHTNINNNRYAQPQPPRQAQVQQQQMAAVPPTNFNSTLQEETTNTEDDEEEKKNPQNDDDSDNNDSDFEDDLDDDAALEAFRRRRLAELKQSATKEDEQRAKGHGEVRTIVQDEFLPECTSSKWVVVHFFHKDFERCKIMDHHLNRIAPLHLSCKFVRIDAEKTPFFVTKLNIRTLPTLLIFKDGKTVDRLVGFEGLLSTNSSFKNPDEFTTSSLGRFLERTGCIEYEGPDSDDDDDEGGRESHNAAARATVRKGLMQSRLNAYDEDF